MLAQGASWRHRGGGGVQPGSEPRALLLTPLHLSGPAVHTESRYSPRSQAPWLSLVLCSAPGQPQEASPGAQLASSGCPRIKVSWTQTPQAFPTRCGTPHSCSPAKVSPDLPGWKRWGCLCSPGSGHPRLCHTFALQGFSRQSPWGTPRSLQAGRTLLARLLKWRAALGITYGSTSGAPGDRRCGPSSSSCSRCHVVQRCDPGDHQSEIAARPNPIQTWLWEPCFPGVRLGPPDCLLLLLGLQAPVFPARLCTPPPRNILLPEMLSPTECLARSSLPGDRKSGPRAGVRAWDISATKAEGEGTQNMPGEHLVTGHQGLSQQTWGPCPFLWLLQLQAIGPHAGGPGDAQNLQEQRLQGEGQVRKCLRGWGPVGRGRMGQLTHCWLSKLTLQLSLGEP